MASTPLTQTEQDELEELIDRHTLSGVLGALAIIAQGKAAHIRENWQDDTTAGCWRYAARQIDKAIAKVEV